MFKTKKNIDRVVVKILNNKKVKIVYSLFCILFTIVFLINTFITFKYPEIWKLRISSEDSSDESKGLIHINKDKLSDSIVTFKNKQLEIIVRDKLGINNDPLYSSDIDQFVNLDLRNLKLRSINDIKYFRNLKNLNLSGNEITDISELSYLSKLSTLTLYNNKISDITPLAYLDELTMLDISFNQVTKIDPLKTLGNLEDLDLSFNNINEVTPIYNLKNLKILDISKNKIINKSYLDALKDVNNLYDWGN